MRIQSPTPRAAAAMPALPAACLARPEPAVPGCGWYDSSFELSRGLEISEQADDAVFWLWALAKPH